MPKGGGSAAQAFISHFLQAHGLAHRLSASFWQAAGHAAFCIFDQIT